MTSQTCCHGDKVVPAAVGSRTWSHGDWIVTQLETADWIVTHLGPRIEKKYLVPFWYLSKQFTLYFALTWHGPTLLLEGFYNSCFLFTLLLQYHV